MPGKLAQLTPLETRKQLLLLESELNRAQLLREVGDFKNEIRHLKQQACEISSLASSAAKVAGTVSAVGRVFSYRDDNEKGSGSWISTLFNGAKAGAALWFLLRSWRRNI
jgi:hypothetical protein